MSLVRRHLPISAALMATLLLAAACSGSDEPTASGPADTGADTGSGSGTTVAPAPDGPSPAEPGDHEVGRRTLTFTDPSRDDRELVVDVWYPADPDAVADASLSVYDFLPGIEFTAELAYADVPVDAGEAWPLVIFSHGSGGLRFQGSDNAELLASHGFVVAAPDHVGNTAFGAFLGTQSPPEQRAVDRPLDTAFVITELLAQSSGTDGPLAGAVDGERIGIYGHSFGGFTALAAASGTADVPADARIDAVIGMAPYTEILSDEQLGAVDVPTLLLGGTADTTTPIEDNTERPWELIPGRPLYRVDIEGAGHQSFADVCEYQQLAAELPDAPELIVDAIDGFAVEGCAPELVDIDTAHEIIDTYTVAFLEAYVAGDDAAAAFLTPAYAETFPEVTFEVKTG